MSRSTTLWKARRLERQGRYTDAIELLTASAGRSDDPAVLERLVKLRHEGFASSAAGHGRPEWPPAYDDRFEVQRVAPEIDGSQLDAAAIGAGISHHGCLLVRGLLDDEQISTLTDVVTNAYRAAAESVPAGDGWRVPFNPPGTGLAPRREWARAAGAIWIGDSPQALFRVLRTFDDLGLPAILTEYFGERPAFSLEKATLRQVTTDVNPDWHQDGAFMGHSLRSLNLWITLTPCGGEATVPALDILPRRLDDFVETGTRGAQLDNFVGRDLIAELAVDCPVERPAFEPGDALIFDDHFLHCTGVSPGMGGVRQGVEFWFFAPSTVPEQYVPMLL